MQHKRMTFLVFSSIFLPLCLFVYESDLSFEVVHMSFEGSKTEESTNSLSEVSSLEVVPKGGI